MSYRNYILRTAVFLMLILGSFGLYSTVSAQSLDTDSQAYHYFRDGLLLARQGHYDEAISNLQKAARIDTSAVILRTLGEIYIKPTVRKYDLAAGVYEKHLEKNPHDDRIINIILQIYTSLKRLPRAQNVLSKVITAGNIRPEYYVTLIDLYLKDKKVPDAQNTSLLYIERAGESENSCQQVAELFISNSMIVEGLEYFEDYVKRHPDVDNLGLAVGILYEAREDFRAAEKSYLNVLRKNEYASRTRSRLARIYIGSEEFDSAMNLYENINFDDPTEIPVKLQICERLLGYDEPPFERIEQIMLTVKDKFGTGAQVYYMLGMALNGQSRFGEAEEYFRKSTRMEPGNFISYYYLANALYSQEKHAEALTAISRAVELRPDIKDFYVLKGLLHDRLGDTQKAMDTYEIGIKIKSPNNQADPTLLNNFGYLLAKQNQDLDKALDMAKKAVLAEPENSSFLDTIGWIYFKLGKYEDALNYIHKSINLEPDNAEVLDHLGDVYEKLDQMSKAVEFWQKALEHDSENESIKEKLRKKK